MFRKPEISILNKLISKIQKYNKMNDFDKENERYTLQALIVKESIICPEILSIKINKFDDNNLAMICATLGFEDVVLEALKNDECALQQNRYGQNLGMLAAKSNLKIATQIALKNTFASTQQDNDGCNIGMYVMSYCDDNLCLLALDNLSAATEQDKSGLNMGMYAASFLKIGPMIKAYQIPECANQTDENGRTIVDYAKDNKIDSYLIENDFECV